MAEDLGRIFHGIHNGSDYKYDKKRDSPSQKAKGKTALGCTLLWGRWEWRKGRNVPRIWQELF